MQQWKSFGIRALCFVLCIPSVGALLAKLYGVASMQAVALAVALPCSLALAGIWIWAKKSARKELVTRLMIGFVGGLLGTIAYDLIRIPFHIAGQRVFASISAFGIWLADADSSSRFTEVIGWSYHYWNGTTFGIMYGLFMRDRHWVWAIAWAFLLETIAVISPFGRIFSLSGNYYAIAIAYLGHIAYGLPLGALVYNWDDTVDYLASTPGWLIWVVGVIACAAAVGPLVSPERIKHDLRTARGEFRVEAHTLNPDWLRIERGEQILIYNPEAESVSVRVKQTNIGAWVATVQKGVFSFSSSGIYQVFVETDRQSRSSFVIVEPVEEVQ